MINKFIKGDRVALPPEQGAYIGKVIDIDGDELVLVKWNGGELIAPGGTSWEKTTDLRRQR